MGEVYLARDPLLSRTVAIKLLPTAFADDPDRLRRFEQEAQATAALNHPRILAVHDVGRIGDQPFIVMEYVRGETLAAYIKRNRPSLRRSLEIGIEIASALDAAHRARIVHRDLKPANVMLTGDGHVKVLDFGLAKFLLHDTSAPTTHGVTPREETITGQLLGTPPYMSPEQLLGDQVDQRTDIYTLGVILFELVAGQRPHEGDILELLRNAALTTPVRTVRDVDSSVPPEISEAIARCMARNPANRFQRAGEVEAELQRLLAEDPRSSQVRYSSGGSQSGARVEKRRIYRFAAWLLAGALAIGAVAAIPFVNDLLTTDAAPNESPVIAVLPFENATGEASNSHLGRGIAYSLTTSLDRLPSISVVSLSNMLEDGALDRSPREIARDFGATLVVLGGIQESGGRLRIDARLEAPGGGRPIWSGYAQGNRDELFTMQKQLAEALLSALSVSVTEEDRRRLARPPTKNDDALRAYWQGLALLDRPDDEDFEAAIKSLRLATTLDPGFSRAFAAIGEAHRVRSITRNDAAMMDEAE